MFRSLIRSTALVMTLALVSLGVHAGGIDCSVQEVLQMTYKERLEALKRCSPPEQAELYIRSVEASHPPQLSLADAISPSGAALVPHLIRTLDEQPESAARLGFVLFAMVRMKDTGSFDASRDPSLLGDMKARVSAIKDPEARAWSEELMASLKAE